MAGKVVSGPSNSDTVCQLKSELLHPTTEPKQTFRPRHLFWHLFWKFAC